MDGPSVLGKTLCPHPLEPQGLEPKGEQAPSCLGGIALSPIVRMQFIAEFGSLGMRRHPPDATGADHALGRLEHHCQLKRTTRLFVLPADVLLHPLLDLLPPQGDLGRRPQEAGVRLIRLDGVPVVCQ
jgi:hypothetical protein